MILSSRQMPHMSLRRPGLTVTDYSGSPRSPGMSKTLLHHLTQTPPPSPSLPSLKPRHGKAPAPRRFRSGVRFLIWLCGVGIITCFVISRMIWEGRARQVDVSTPHGTGAYNLKEQTQLPDEPAAIMVRDKRGRARWTVSIPPALSFPLPPSAYAKICSQSTEVSMRVASLKSHGKSSGAAAHRAYYQADRNYMEVDEAEEHGLLPGLQSKTSTSVRKMWNSVMGEDGEDQDIRAMKETLEGLSICQRSLTYVLETEDAGFGATMMGLWMSYGLAQKEGRAFFIDDTNWAYGKYSAYFAPPPRPSCLPPPRTQIVPCPHQARHLLVSAATTQTTFGHAFNEEFENSRAMEVQRQQPIFALLRAGHEALFHLRPDDEAYVTARKAELMPAASQAGIRVGIHVRHGDRHPLEFQYQESYIPLDRYTAAAHALISATYNSSGHLVGHDMTTFALSSSLILASDDPEVYTSEEFHTTTTRAQERIALASKSVLDAQAADTSSNRPFVDESIGWEGGFFPALFWTLGATAPTASAKIADLAAKRELAPTALALQLRELVGRTYLLDLKVLGEATDGVVCGVSAIGCRLLAVMMGWEKAIEKGRWRNVDGDFNWKGIAW